jgi:hydroxypyruvate reductase
VKYGFTEELSVTETVEAGHPLPDENGMAGAKKIMELLSDSREEDLVISLISGGGSALLPLPAADITLVQKQNLTRELLACGASIHEINAVRKHISLTKGGQMARAAFPATVVNLMLSDVVGDNLDVIASGPFVPDSSTFGDVSGILKKYDLKDIPETIRRHIETGVKGDISETPKENDPIFDKVYNIIVGSNIIALEAARVRAEDLGYNTIILSSLLEGETKIVSAFHCSIAKEILKTGRPIPAPACVISGGETTVTIKGEGLGGRNQEFCLAAALGLQDIDRDVVILSGGTDGNDGPTDAAGAVIDQLSVERGQDLGVDAWEYLKNNNSYHYFQKTGELLITGPTNTNVMDVRLILALD